MRTRTPLASTLVLAAAALLPLPAVLAQAPAVPAPDKSGYSLFNPVPRELMREMSTDRPDTTESPFTVDAGHVQLEMSVVDFNYDHHNDADTTVRAWAVAPFLIKFGLTNSIDLQIGLDPWTTERSEDRATGTVTTNDGFGDTVVRVKFNLFGNDPVEGDSGWAMALMPFIKLPTASDDLGNDHVEGGLIAVAGTDLCEGWGVGFMLETDFLHSEDNGTVVDLVHTVTVGHDLSESVGFYVEYAGFLSLNDEEDYRAYFDAGLTYALSSDVQLDCGIRAGLTEASDDFGAFAGVSFRW